MAKSNNKYFTPPTTAQALAELYENAKSYNDDLELADTVETNRNFYIGKQWEGVDVNGITPCIVNIIRPSVQIALASIMAEDVGLAVRPNGIPGATTEQQKLIAEVLTNELSRLWEKQKMTKKVRDTLESAAIDGDGCWHTYWNDKQFVSSVDPSLLADWETVVNSTEVAQMDIDMGVNSAQAQTEESEPQAVDTTGDICTEQILNTRCFFGNTNDPDVQSQPWVMIASRYYTASLKQRADDNGVNASEIDKIVGAADDYFDDDQETRTTLLTYYYRDEGTGTIWQMEATEDVVIKEATDTGVTLYPIAWCNWLPRINSYHGEAKVTEMVYNQHAINVLATMAEQSASRTAFPTVIYRADLIPDGYDNAVGAQIGVHGFVEDMNNIIKVVDGSNYGYQVDNFMNYLVTKTMTLHGATDATLGDIQPDNTSAIIAAQKASVAPLELHRQELYSFIEDWARIQIEYMSCFYGVRPVSVVDMKSGKDIVFEFDFDKIKTTAFDVKIDIGGSSYWSEINEIQTLDNLLTKGLIDAPTYIENLPRGVFTKKNELVKQLKEQQQLQLQQIQQQQQLENAAAASKGQQGNNPYNQTKQQLAESTKMDSQAMDVFGL